jgi:hypothetical protein
MYGTVVSSRESIRQYTKALFSRLIYAFFALTFSFNAHCQLYTRSSFALCGFRFHIPYLSAFSYAVPVFRIGM